MYIDVMNMYDNKSNRLRPSLHSRSFIASFAMSLLLSGLMVGTAYSDQSSSSYNVDQYISEPSSLTTIDQYLQFAVANSPELKSAYYKWQVAIGRAGYAGALPNPMLTYAEFIESVETRVGPQERRFGIRQSLPWFGTLGRKTAIAQSDAERAEQRFLATAYRVLYKVKAAYYNYYLLGRKISLTSDNFELLKFWETITRSRYKVGLNEHPDLIKSQVELGKIEERLGSLTDRLVPIQVHLRSLLELTDQVELTLPITVKLVEEKINGESVLVRALEQNPDIVAAIKLIERQESNRSLASKKTMPSFTFGLDYVQTGDAIDPTMTGSGKDPWNISVSLSLPIWFGANSSRKQEATASLNSAHQQLIQSEQSIKAKVAQVVYEYNDALRKLRLYRDGLVPKAQQALEAIFTSYQSGNSSFLSLLDSQRELLDFQLKQEIALAMLAIKKAEIEMIAASDSELLKQK